MVNPLNFDGQTILVTGASSGIGRETAILLSQLGAKVVLVARDLERLHATLAGMSGDDHLVVAVDLTDIADMGGWLKTITSESGPLSGLVHCAGVHRLIPIRGITQQSIDDLMKINFVTALALAQAARQRGTYVARQMSIVFVSSVMALVGQPGATVYSGTKGALVAASRSLALELVQQGIRVNCVVPGQVKTPMTRSQKQMLTAAQFQQIEDMHPMGIGEPLDVAYACTYLLSNMARWVTGTALVVDGGYSAH